ncbi:MAG: TPR domain protein in aerotolerance operon [uncultured Thiotrichaceae bacterium]|uniref:TPR domain protein in aerotolerance operon n=1 Tax=uncultured Thiotrichaceae bacterium TaxID=298394 RepID=A0A6S6TRR1_9GAMM|nr:MAG: TPR domain protein in aerotolerance operon [uncultured Thiotrichaceae bacterium]
MVDFHFIYPLWLIFIPVLAFVFYSLAKYVTKVTVWDAFIDKALQPFVVSSGEGKSKHWLFWLMAVLSMLMVIALAGPSWQKRSLPGYKVNHGLVIALDLSASMLTKDIAPDRLARAKFELNDLMQLRIEGQTGLVVFAGDAFAVAPMTEDVDTITAQVEHLDPYTMPAQGSRVDRAIEVAHDLLKNGGYPTGHILLITDGTSTPSKTLKQAKQAANDGFLVSVMQIGTAKGDVIPLRGGGFLVNREEKRIRAIVDEAGLKEIAATGQGYYVVSTINDDDIDRLFTFMQVDETTSLEKATDKKINYSENAGIWLLFPIVVLMLLLFRKGYLFLLFIVVLQQPQPVYAFDWQSLWKTPDQRGQHAFEQGDFEYSEKLFKDKQWQASSAYEKGDYEAAEQLFAESDTTNAQYNRANALAKQKRYKEAISAYQDVLEESPDHEDALANMALVEGWLKEQESPPPKDQSESEKQEKQEDSKGGESQEEESNKENKSGEQETESDDQEGKEGKEGKEAKEQAEADKKALENFGKEEKKPEQEKKGEEMSSLEQKKDKEEGEEFDVMRATEQEKAAFQKQFLKKVPDDPSGLWARKFQYQYRQRRQKMEEQQW